MVIGKITALLDLENGKHILAGDSNGTLFLWNHEKQEVFDT
jgi:hypothetical protein